MAHAHCAPSRTFYLSHNFSFSNSTTNIISLSISYNDSVDVLPITSRCISDQVTKCPDKIFRSHDVFRTTYEMSDLIRIRIGSEGATDSSDFPTQNSYFVFLTKTIPFILPYFECGIREIFLSPIFGLTREELKMDSQPLKGLKKRGRQPERLDTASFLS